MSGDKRENKKSNFFRKHMWTWKICPKSSSKLLKKKSPTENLLMAEVVMNIDEDAALIVAAPPGASLLRFVSKHPAGTADQRRVILHHRRSPTRPPNRERLLWLTMQLKGSLEEEARQLLQWPAGGASHCVLIAFSSNFSNFSFFPSTFVFNR